MRNFKDFIEESLIEETLLFNKAPKTKQELRKLIEKMVSKKQFKELNNIDTSHITDMSYLFEDLDISDIDISAWDVSHVENMKGMFYGCSKFNSDLSGWDVSNVKDMSGMFYGCKNFNCDLSVWDVRQVKNMYGAFEHCKAHPKWYKDR